MLRWGSSCGFTAALGVLALAVTPAGASAASPTGPQAQHRTASLRITGVHVSRSGSVVTVRFRVNRLTRVRVTVRDHAGHVVGRSPLRTARPGHEQRIHVPVRRAVRGPVRATVRSQPEFQAP